MTKEEVLQKLKEIKEKTKGLMSDRSTSGTTEENTGSSEQFIFENR